MAHSNIETFLKTYKEGNDANRLLAAGKVRELLQEVETWRFIATGLTQEHQQSVKLQILQKADNILSQIEDIIACS